MVATDSDGLDHLPDYFSWEEGPCTPLVQDLAIAEPAFIAGGLRSEVSSYYSSIIHHRPRRLRDCLRHLEHRHADYFLLDFRPWASCCCICDRLHLGRRLLGLLPFLNIMVALGDLRKLTLVVDLF